MRLDSFDSNSKMRHKTELAKRISGHACAPPPGDEMEKKKPCAATFFILINVALATGYSADRNFP